MPNKSYLVQKTCNQLLDWVVANSAGAQSYMPSVLSLAEEMGVSRTTIRAALAHLVERGLIADDTTGKRILRKPKKADYCQLGDEPASREATIEKYFLSLIHSGRLLPGSRFSELELAKQSGCNTVTVREFLARFSRFGLIEKKPRSQWQMVRFDHCFAAELIEFRKVLEMRALVKLLELEGEHPVWSELSDLLALHRAVLQDFEHRHGEVSALDVRLHRALLSGTQNRFISQFFEVVSFVCHYHYQWDKSGQKERLRVALTEHIELLIALLAGDAAAAVAALEAHLDTAERTLLDCATQVGRAG